MICKKEHVEVIDCDGECEGCQLLVRLCTPVEEDEYMY